MDSVDAEIAAALANGPADGPPWRALLRRNSLGAILPSTSNTLLILTHDPALVDILQFDEFRDEYRLLKPAPGGREFAAPRALADADEILVQVYLQAAYPGLDRLPRNAVRDAITTAARRHTVHPVREYLSGLVWDGKPRLDRWLYAAFDADGDEQPDYVRAVGTRVPVAAVRRIFHPGCKFDHLMVLEGSQGIGKSAAIRAMVPDPAWFSDSVHADLTSKDAAAGMAGVWLIEFPEIEHLLRSSSETVKSFLSRQVDRYRPPYERNTIERPRESILIGTSNRADYGRDDTGNRRLWPIACRHADTSWIELNRDQLWAEAVCQERQGLPIWLDNSDVAAVATEIQAERMVSDSWSDQIGSYVRGRLDVRTSDILRECLEKPTGQITRSDQMRVATILRTMGWVNRRQRSNGEKAMVWTKERVGE